MRSKEGRDLREWKEGENEGERGGRERRERGGSGKREREEGVKGERKENEKKSQMLTTNVGAKLQN